MNKSQTSKPLECTTTFLKKLEVNFSWSFWTSKYVISSWNTLYNIDILDTKYIYSVYVCTLYLWLWGYASICVPERYAKGYIKMVTTCCGRVMRCNIFCHVKVFNKPFTSELWKLLRRLMSNIGVTEYLSQSMKIWCNCYP